MKAINEVMRILALAVLMASLLLGVATAQDPSDGLVPVVRFQVPNLSPTTAKVMPPSFSVGIMGTDPDAESTLPVKYRYLLVSAQYDTTVGGEPLFIKTPQEFAQYGADLLPWDEPSWGAWEVYPSDGTYPMVEVVGLNDGEYYLMAAQVMDADGAVSATLDYQLEVLNIWVREFAFRPEVTICEQFLGCPQTSLPANQIAASQPLNFGWIASADAYGGTIVSYRHGWDLIDPDDPNDPGWAVPPGLAPENLYAQERSFNDGIHVFHLRVEDNIGQVRKIAWQLQVVPYVDRQFQLELLVIDQTVDDLTNRWPDQMGLPRDDETYRNGYWQFLAAGSGGVSNFDWIRDRKDHRDQVSYSDLVNYKAVLCYARNNMNQTMFQQFRPVNGQDRFVWLAPYQYGGGNYFQVGEKSMDSILESQSNYMIPIIFDAAETSLVIGQDTFILGFGQKEQPDGSLVMRGPLMYPYATAGITAMDWTSPGDKYIYPRTTVAKFDRAVDCVGLKGLVLDADFRTHHAVGPAAIADTFFTDQVIDWQDAVAVQADTIGLFNSSFPFRDDEFVNRNLSSRVTPIIPQECDVPEAPGGMCVEPMFTGISRMDWLREHKWAGGDPAWPFSEYTDWELDDGCGDLGLTAFQSSPKSSGVTNGGTFGYLSYKTIENKPVRKADVYWGFDPYRFDQDETKKAIRWVLDYFGLQINP